MCIIVGMTGGWMSGWRWIGSTWSVACNHIMPMAMAMDIIIIITTIITPPTRPSPLSYPRMDVSASWMKMPPPPQHQEEQEEKQARRRKEEEEQQQVPPHRVLDEAVGV